MNALPTRTLLYRYLFYGWLFRNVNRGNVFERAQAWRHNREQAQWLPTYLRRWTTCGLLGLCTGALLERALSSPWLAAALYVGCTVAVAYCVVTLVTWIFLTRDVRLG